MLEAGRAVCQDDGAIRQAKESATAVAVAKIRIDASAYRGLEIRSRPGQTHQAAQGCGSAMAEEVFAGIGVFPSPHHVIQEIVMDVDENPKHEQKHVAAEGLPIIRDDGVEV